MRLPWAVATHSPAPGAEPEPAHSKDPSIGVHVLYAPPDGVEPTVDIVAVHGLKGDAFKTWTSKGSTPDKDVLWLRDLLPKDIPTARILTYGYDSDPGKVFESASTNMVLHHATTLVSELHYFRRYPNDKHRPIIFVCHSLGGIVVKRALIYSSTCNISHNPELRSIRVCTSGILFLGTPHMGADLARWGKMAESLVRTVMTKAWIDSNESLVNALGKNSETLQNITDSFVGLAPEFQMAFFWEELGTNLGGLTRDVIVEKTSAVLEMPNAKKAGIHATHTEMCKFATTRAPGWNMVSGVLMEFAASAPGRVAIKWRQLEDHEYLDISWKMEGLISQRRTPSPRRVQGSPKIGSVLLEGAQQQHLTGPDERKLLEAPPAFFKPNHLQENKFFCGRKKELEKVHRTLSDRSKGIVLISSITGGGKTHLARQYFFSRRSEYSGGVFWVECKDVTTGKFSAEVITKWYCAIADELRLPETTVTTTPEQTVMDVVAWFNKKSDWLLVLDGVDIDHDSQYSTIAGYMPRTDAGSIIMTSINPALAGSARLGSPYPLALDPPSLDEAVAMLVHYSQIPNATPSAEYTDLCRALTCLPLAIHAAASYIKETQSPVADFLKKYQRGPFVERRYLEPFHVVFDRLETRFPQAAALIKLLSFWGRGAGGGVPHLMLWWGVRPLHKSQLVKLIAREANRRPADLDVSISQCLRLGIMERGLETGVEGLGGDSGIDTLRLHPIAKAVCIARMKENKELETWCHLATDVFCNSFEYLDSRRRRSSLDDDPIRKGQDVEFLLSDYARYLTHGIQIMDSIRRYKLPSSERLMEVHSRVQKLTNPDDVSAKVERVSMFLTSGSSSTSGPDLDSPTTPLPDFFRVESPVEVRRHSIDREVQEERERILKENASKLEFTLRYEPPKGPKSWVQRGRSGSGRGGPGRSSTMDSWRGSPKLGTGRGVRSNTGFSGVGDGTAELGVSRGRSPTPVPRQTVPYIGLPQHYDPYVSRGAGPWLGRHHHQPVHHQQSSSAPAWYGIPPGAPSPAYTPAYPFLSPSAPYTLMPGPPYPVTPGYEIANPIRPRPFTPGFQATRDVTQSPVLRPVLDVYRSPSIAPSEACSEPIVRSRSHSPAVMFAMEGFDDRRSIPLVNSPWPPPPSTPPPRHGLGIEFSGSPGFLQPKINSDSRSRSTSAVPSGLRRSSVPTSEHGDEGSNGGGAEMSRSRSEPGAPAQMATMALRAGLWMDGKEKEE